VSAVRLQGTLSHGSELKVTVSYDTSRHRVMKRVHSNQLFVYFNITGWHSSEQQRTLALRISVQNNNGISLNVNNVITLAGVEHGPLMVLAPSYLIENGKFMHV
jgi:hypothetical protein